MAPAGRQCCRRNPPRTGRLSITLTALDRLVRDRIATEGRIAYDEVVELALYHPEHGFYSRGGRAGRRGDFITSPEVGPLFGVLVAEAIDRDWDRCDQPDRFTVVDAGAGPGTLARAVLSAAPRCIDALEYVAVERSALQREQHPVGVLSIAEFPSEPLTGVVIANELLDNLRFGPGCSIGVEDDRLVELGSGGSRVIQQPGAIEWLSLVLGVLQRGRVIVIDYCREQSSDVEIRTYAAHGRGRDPLVALGTQDITVDVDLQQLQSATRPADVISTQPDWLDDLGLAALVEEGRAAWHEGAAVGDLDSLRARSRIREAEALTDPTGLGSFTVAQWIA